ncbi:hypothetical protein GWK47_003499 [Chionoecetes opilio]|uniref:Uncharacterized protein n=1 Tax=Chionoecetes opilio TaxID=41210 RepID=A0A8J5D2J9_CHIOP|nr:hypothetical protein GWK47_003499 [Chionoecetes opilio]
MAGALASQTPFPRKGKTGQQGGFRFGPEGHDVLEVPTLWENPKMWGWRSPGRHRRRVSTPLRRLAVQLSGIWARLGGFPGLGRGWMSASFPAEGKGPRPTQGVDRAQEAAPPGRPGGPASSWEALEAPVHCHQFPPSPQSTGAQSDPGGRALRTLSHSPTPTSHMMGVPVTPYPHSKCWRQRFLRGNRSRSSSTMAGGPQVFAPEPFNVPLEDL